MLYWCKKILKLVYIRCNKFYKARAEVTGLPPMMTAGSKLGAEGRNRAADSTQGQLSAGLRQVKVDPPTLI